MTETIEKDPITQAYEYLYNQVKNDDRIKEMCNKGNFISIITKKLNPFKSGRTEGDMPELALVPVGASVMLSATSTSAEFQKRFQWQLATGNWNAGDDLFPVEYELVRVLARTKANMSNDSACPRTLWQLELSEITNSDQDPDINRNKDGYSALVEISCTIHIDLRSL